MTDIELLKFYQSDLVHMMECNLAYNQKKMEEETDHKALALKNGCKDNFYKYPYQYSYYSMEHYTKSKLQRRRLEIRDLMLKIEREL